MPTHDRKGDLFAAGKEAAIDNRKMSENPIFQIDDVSLFCNEK